MGLVEGGSLGWGMEGSGVVTAVGPEVTKLKVGDRIMTMTSNFLCSERTISADRCVKIPDSLSFEAAATMPCVYATVIHCLIKVGGLQKGQTILIHSACGGVGLAAIQICQNVIGAKVHSINLKTSLMSDMLIKLDICDSGQRREETVSHRKLWPPARLHVQFSRRVLSLWDKESNGWARSRSCIEQFVR
jgi:hypothetical protein